MALLTVVVLQRTRNPHAQRPCNRNRTSKRTLAPLALPDEGDCVDVVFAAVRARCTAPSDVRFSVPSLRLLAPESAAGQECTTSDDDDIVGMRLLSLVAASRTDGCVHACVRAACSGRAASPAAESRGALAAVVVK
jgi:hypothetical protein